MKYIIAIGALLIATQSASACHHYSQWHYKTPQKCDESNSEPIKIKFHKEKNKTAKFEIKHESEVKPEVQKVIPDICPYDTNTDPRQHAICLLIYQLKVLEANRKAGVENYKQNE
jgi:hypothetical protein